RTAALVLLCPQVHRWDDRSWLPATSRWTLPLLRRPLLRRLLLKLYPAKLGRMTVAQFLKMEAGERYREAAADPACMALCETTLAAMAQGTRCAGFANDFAVFINEDILGPDSTLRARTLIIHD